jgi:hypothetical protein
MTGTVVTPLQGHFDIAFACITYLANCTDLVKRGDEFSSGAMHNIAEGYHSLQLYANAFWIDHFLEFAALNSNIHKPGLDPLVNQLRYLHALHKKYPASVPDNVQCDLRAELSAIIDISVSHLANWKDVQGFLKEILTHRQSLARMQEKATSKYFMSAFYEALR